MAEKKIGVCVLDSGIYQRHIEFDDRLDAFVDFVNNRDMPYDDNGHGTHVTGILAGHSISICNDVRIISIKVLDNKGRGSVNSLCKACNWILNNREKYNIKLANISVGANVNSKEEKLNRLLSCVEGLCDSGVIVLCAAGNNGPREGSITVPGTSRKVITVGSVNGKGADYSGRGKSKNGVIKPDFVAYGTNVRSASLSGGYEYRSGTSMATPIVGQVVGGILSKRMDAEVVFVKALLKEMAEDVHLPVNRQGYGLIEPSKCVEKIAEM